MGNLICSGCQCEIKVGDRYIEDSASGFTGVDPSCDELVAMVLGSNDSKVRFCEDCTQPGGEHLFQTNYGEEGN